MGFTNWDGRAYMQSFKLAVKVHKIGLAQAQWTSAWTLGGMKTHVPNKLEIPNINIDILQARLQGKTRAAFTRALVYNTHGPFIVR